MKKLIFVAVVLAMTMGVFSETQAFWPFKKANKVEVRNEQAENGAVINILAIKEASETSKLHINKEGTGFSLLAGGALVKSRTTDTLTTEISFGTSKVSLIVKANDETKVFRRFKAKTQSFNFSNIETGDNLAVEGLLDTSAGTLTVTARKIQDYSAQARDANYSGTIKSINAEAKTFVLDLPSSETDLTVVVNASTTIKKSQQKNQETPINIGFERLAVNDVVKNATGVVNTQTMRLLAREVLVTERDISQRTLRNVFATVVSVDQGNSMVVKTTTNIFYTVSFINSATSYRKWTVSKKYSGKKEGTDGVSTPSTLNGLNIKAEDKVWIDGTVDIATNKVNPTIVFKEFYK